LVDELVQSDRGAIIAGAMEREAVDPAGSAADRVVAHARVSAEQLSSVLSRTAAALEKSASLAEEHAARYERGGRSDDAVEERRVAGRAREAATSARSSAGKWLEFAAGRKP
jgi:hypothetical protein